LAHSAGNIADDAYLARMAELRRSAATMRLSIAQAPSPKDNFFVDVVIAAAVPALISVVAGAWAWRRLDRYFRKFVAARGPVARARPWFRFGMGLDDLAVGTWDAIPAWRVVTQDTGDPELERDRRRARSAAVLFLSQLPGSFVEGAVLVAVLRSDPVVMAIVAFASWVLASLPIQYRMSWLSRPELREFQLLGLRAYGLVVAIVAGSLLLAGVVVALALVIRD
jgi:hypothetical protein